MPGRRIVIAGGTGFIGERLVTALVTAGEDVVVLSRGGAVPRGAKMARWDGHTAGDWASELNGAHAVINLAGEPIAQRWSPRARQRIVESRTDSVAAICEAAQQCTTPPRQWINASAVGFYGNRGSEEVDETAARGSGFLADTCVAWEEAVLGCTLPAIYKTRLRIGMVLGHGGALLPLAKLARLGLGGPAGSGTQIVSWIHLDDLVGLIQCLLEFSRPPEVVNATSPNAVTNAELMRRIRQVVHAPFWLPAPGFAVRLVGKAIGPDAEVILSGVRAVPRAALQMGYSFHCSDLVSALEDVLER